MIAVVRSSDRRMFFFAFSGDDSIVREILSFLRLREGWHFGSGRPPTGATVISAIAVANALRAAGAECLEAFPDSDGGILIAGYHKDETMEVLCRPHGEFELVHERGDDEIGNFKGLNLGDVMREIRVRSWQQGNLFGFYTPNILVQEKRDTLDLHSRIPQAVEFQSLIPAVLPQPASRYATISSDITRWQSPGIHQFSGALATTFFRQQSY